MAAPNKNHEFKNTTLIEFLCVWLNTLKSVEFRIPAFLYLKYLYCHPRRSLPLARLATPLVTCSFECGTSVTIFLSHNFCFYN
jgi:hypothetical protein